MSIASQLVIPHPQVLHGAVLDLERQLKIITLGERPSRTAVESALALLEAESHLLSVYAARFREAVLVLPYDVETRVRAGEAALELMKQDLGLDL